MLLTTLAGYKLNTAMSMNKNGGNMLLANIPASAGNVFVVHCFRIHAAVAPSQTCGLVSCAAVAANLQVCHGLGRRTFLGWQGKACGCPGDPAGFCAHAGTRFVSVLHSLLKESEAAGTEGTEHNMLDCCCC